MRSGHDAVDDIMKIPMAALPGRLAHIPNPPRSLFVRTGSEYSLEELLARPRVAIVGSRKLTPYGQKVTAELATALSACPPFSPSEIASNV